MKNKTITDNRSRRYIRIEKDYVWDQIDMLSSVDKYSKSFNKIINEALEIGLPELIKKTFCNGIDDVKSQKNEANYQADFDFTPQKKQDNNVFENQVLRLLKENIINALVIKDNVNSLFEAKNLELHGKRVDPEYFEKGYYQNTPKYLQSFEINELKKLREWRE